FPYDRGERRPEMVVRSSVDIVHAFWERVWQQGDIEAVDDFVVEDFVIVNAGRRIESRAAFKQWARDFRTTISDFRFDVEESFQNEDGSRVASLWRITGRNNGVFGTKPDGEPIEITGTAIWDVSAEGKLLRNRVERSAFEAYRRLIG